MPTSKKGLISLKIHDPRRQVYEGQVLSITSVNDSGKFDILYKHTNFISVIYDKVIFVESTNKKYEISLTRGVIKFEDGNADVFIGIDSLL